MSQLNQSQAIRFGVKSLEHEVSELAFELDTIRSSSFYIIIVAAISLICGHKSSACNCSYLHVQTISHCTLVLIVVVVHSE